MQHDGLPSFTKATITLEGNGSTIRRANSAPHFRLLHIAASGRLIVHDLVLANGMASDGLGAAIRVSGGDLFVTGSQIRNNLYGAIMIMANSSASFVATRISANDQAAFWAARKPGCE